MGVSGSHISLSEEGGNEDNRRSPVTRKGVFKKRLNRGAGRARKGKKESHGD